MTEEDINQVNMLAELSQFDAVVLHIPNERIKPKDVELGEWFGYLNKLKQIGVVEGAADLLFVHQNYTCFIEVKSGTGRQSKKQKRFENACNMKGINYFLYSGKEHEKTTILNKIKSKI